MPTQSHSADAGPHPHRTEVDERVVSHISSTAIEGGTAHPELKLLNAN
ncbi:hypothetical protein ABT025_32640 [Streptomyces sp. NPDC002809]